MFLSRIDASIVVVHEDCCLCSEWEIQNPGNPNSEALDQGAVTWASLAR